MKSMAFAMSVILGCIVTSGVSRASSFNITPDGKIGIGTETPVSQLEVYTTGNSNLYGLSNDGNVGFNMTSRTGNITWRFATTANDDFRISKDATGGPEVVINSDGSVDIGYGSSTVFFLDAAGNLDISGTLQQGSSKTFKRNIVEVDGKQVLQSLMNLPIAEWSYIEDQSNARHVGPIAEDFAAIYGLGRDKKYLAPGDVAGVALAAVKEVAKQLKSKDAEIASLKRQLSELEASHRQNLAHNVSLTARLDRLEGVLRANGGVSVAPNAALKTNSAY